MTVVTFDEPSLHVDTDASGEPCIVAENRGRGSARPTRAPFPRSHSIENIRVKSEIASAFAADNVCLVCQDPIESVDHAAYVTTHDRVVHQDPCLSRYLAIKFGSREERATRRLLSTNYAHGEGLLQQHIQALMEDADRDLDHVLGMDGSDAIDG